MTNFKMIKFSHLPTVLFSCFLAFFSTALIGQNTGSCANDTTKPTFTSCPRNIVLTTLDTCVVAEWATPRATDNCGTPTLTSTHQSLNCFEIGVTNVVYTATDAKGNKATCTFSVTANNPCANDTTKPRFFFCPSNITKTTTDSCKVVDWNDPFATDNCGIPTLTASHESGDCFIAGVHNIIYTARDAKNNTATCTFKVTVINACANDTIKPIFTKCPSNIVLNTSDSCAVATWSTPTATDNCSTPSVIGSHQSRTCFKVGVTNVTYTAKDSKGNTALCTFKVTVNNPCFVDTIKPVFSRCPENIVLNTSDSCATATWSAPSATDNCSTPTITASHLSRTCFKVGITKVTYTAKDAKGNTATCTFNVTVKNPCFADTIKPVFQSCPRNIVFNSSDTCVRAQWTAPTATDNCGTPSITSSHRSGFCFKSGVTTVIYTAKDAKNNTATCSFTVTINNPCANDTTKPRFTTCPENIVLNTSDSCSRARWIIPTAYDNCGIPSVVGSHKQDTCFKSGITTVNYTATDAKGNKAVCSFTVTVRNPCANDTIKPVFYNCPATITKTTSDTATKVEWRNPTAIDNCGNTLMMSSHQSGDLFRLDTTVVLYTATDSRANIAVCSFRVIVKRVLTACSNDTIAPVFTNCPADISVTTSSLSALAQWTLPTATDNCSTPSVNSTFRSGANFPIGTTPVIFVATDAARNTAICRFNVVVTKATLVLDSTKCYVFIARSSKKVLTIANASTAPSAYAVQWSYLDATNQKWQISTADSNSVNLTAKHSNLNLDTRWGSTASGARLMQWGKSTAATQKWQLVLLSNGYYKIINKGSGKALSVMGGSTAINDGTMLTQYDYAGQESQQWSIEEAICSNTNVAGLISNDVLEVEAKPEFKRARIEWVDNTGYKNDYYQVEKLNSNTGNFELLATINNTSFGNELTHQTVYDNAPNEGENTYRVSVIYFDSTSKSSIKHLSFNGLQTIKAFPNPANDYVDIDVSMLADASIEVYLYNSFGQKVAHERVQKGNTSVVHFDVANQQAGSYLIRVTSQGKRDIVKQLQIAR